MEMMEFKLSKCQNLITNLLLNGHFVDNIGLMHGKTGIAFLFYHLAKQTGNKVFETFAGELIDEIIPVLSTKIPVDFENGLAGIGWGVEYLTQNGFLDADTNEVLEDFDKQIFGKFLEKPPVNIDLLSGVLGIGYYFLMRVKGNGQMQKSIISETNRIALQHVCNHLTVVIQHPGDFIKEIYRNSTPKTSIGKGNQDIKPAPVFDITWNLPGLIKFAAEVTELIIQTDGLTKLMAKMLFPLTAVSGLPVLQCNKLLLLQSLGKLKESLEKIPGCGNSEIGLLINQIIKKIVTDFNNEKYIEELGSLDFSVRNGIPGIAIIHQKLYEQTSELKYKDEYTKLLNRLLQQEFIDWSLYDYSNPIKLKEPELGLLTGLSGLLLTVLAPETKL